MVKVHYYNKAYEVLLLHTIITYHYGWYIKVLFVVSRKGGS